MTYLIKLLALPLLAGLSITACAATKLKVSQVAPWTERQFIAMLPQPFNRVDITIISDDAGRVTEFRIVTEAGEVKLPDDQLKQLSAVSEPSVTYDPAEGSMLKHFSVHVEFGSFYYSERFNESFQNIAGWKVNHSMHIRDFEITNYR